MAWKSGDLLKSLGWRSILAGLGVSLTAAQTADAQSAPQPLDSAPLAKGSTKGIRLTGPTDLILQLPAARELVAGHSSHSSHSSHASHASHYSGSSGGSNAVPTPPTPVPSPTMRPAYSPPPEKHSGYFYITGVTAEKKQFNGKAGNLSPEAFGWSDTTIFLMGTDPSNASSLAAGKTVRIEWTEQGGQKTVQTIEVVPSTAK